MKKHCFLSLVAFLLMGSLAYGQIAVQAGYQQSEIIEEYFGDEPFTIEGVKIENELFEMKSGFHIGAVGELDLFDFLAVQAGLIFNEKGYQVVYEPEDDVFNKSITRYRWYHIDLPLVVTGIIPVGNDLEIRPMAGGYGSMWLFGRVATKVEYPDEVQKDNYAEDQDWERFDFGLTFGGSVKYRAFEVGGAYDLGLKDVVWDSDDEETGNEWDVHYRLWKVFGRYWF